MQACIFAGCLTPNHSDFEEKQHDDGHRFFFMTTLWSFSCGFRLEQWQDCSTLALTQVSYVPLQAFFYWVALKKLILRSNLSKCTKRPAPLGLYPLGVGTPVKGTLGDSVG